MSPTLTAKLPGYHFIAGFGFLMAGWMLKDSLPAIGSSPLIQLPCAFFSAVLLPLGSFLALRALVFQVGNRRALLSLHLGGLALLLVLLVGYFYTYVTINRTLDLTGKFSSLLPKLIENAKSFPKEEQRKKQACYAYRYYGVSIAYPLDNLEVVYYVPSEEDKIFRHKMEQDDLKTQQMTVFIKKVTGQFPYLFALYAGTYFCTFLIGGIWLFFKIPARSANGES